MESQVRPYLIRRWIDGAWYGGKIPARSFEEAEDFCRKLGWHLDGEFIGHIPASAGWRLPDLIVRVRNWLTA